MPYLAFDLDAMARAEAAARSIGIPDTLVKGGLLNLWMHCFKEETDRVTAPQVAGFFGVVPIAAPLVAFGFLEEEGDSFRVKGADRYLRIVQGRRKGGQKTAGNLKKGATKPGQSRDRAGTSPRLTPGLSPSTEHRAPNTEEAKDLSAKKPADPRHAPLVKELHDAAPHNAFASRTTSGRDAKAVSALLDLGPPDEVLRRWRRALGRSNYPTVRTLPELVRHWPHFATDSPQKPGAPIDPLTQGHRTEGPITAEEVQL